MAFIKLLYYRNRHNIQFKTTYILDVHKIQQLIATCNRELTFDTMNLGKCNRSFVTVAQAKPNENKDVFILPQHYTGIILDGILPLPYAYYGILTSKNQSKNIMKGCLT